MWERHVFIFELSSIWPTFQGSVPTSCRELTRGVKSLLLPLYPAKKSPKGLDFSLILRHPLFKILGSFMSFCECSKSPFTALKEMGGLKREHGHYSVDVNYHHQGRDLFLEVFWSVLKGWGAALEINNFKRIAKKNTCMEHTHPNCGLAPRDILCLSKLQPYISAAEQTPFLPGVIVISKQLNSWFSPSLRISF